MAMARNKSFVSTLLMAVLMVLVVSESAARRLEGDNNKRTGGEAASGAVVGHPIVIQFLKRLYLQQLSSGPCPSGLTYDPNTSPHCH
ncbi:unnamed protein product [Urochloa decumbens]|uniref:Uncharacterized protein n=1 Tax=Urochloa decumbens TaxID=240449 RepID=A0ABC9ECF3_9POAL